jgi:phosphomannomutase
MDPLVFGTDGWRDVIAERFTYANVARAAAAYAEHLLDAGGKRVLVGFDTRFGGQAFAQVAGQVLAAHGLEVLVSQDYLPTPAFSFAVRHLQADGGVMLTASHNPPQYHGFKLKGPYGGTASPATYEDTARRVGERVPTWDSQRRLESFDTREAYYRALSELVSSDTLAQLPGVLVHDAMGGAATGWLAGFFAWLGLGDKVRELRPEPHPLFYGVNPEPIAHNLAAATAYARAHPTAFIAATDGDGDRIGVVLPGGAFFNSHQVFAVLLDHLSSQGQTGTVVKTVTVSRLIERLAAARGLSVVETPVGFKYITEAMLTGGVLIGGEESGGIGVPAHLPERDGIANALLLAEALVRSGEGLGERFARLERELGWQHAYDRLDLHLSGNALKQAVLAALTGPPATWAGRHVESVETSDGVKLNLEGGAWLMFRPSGTEPLLRVYCEAQDGEAVQNLLRAVTVLVAEPQRHPGGPAHLGGSERGDSDTFGPSLEVAGRASAGQAGARHEDAEDEAAAREVKTSVGEEPPPVILAHPERRAR